MSWSNTNAVSFNELQWINIDGSIIDVAQGVANNAHISDDDITQVLQGNVLADKSRLAFRDPDHFRAGELHRHVVCRLFSDIGSNSGELHGNQSSNNLCICFSSHFLIILRLFVNF